MTWKEFKEYVDRELQEQGESEDIEIAYIDISYPLTGTWEVRVEDQELVII